MGRFADKSKQIMSVNVDKEVFTAIDKARSDKVRGDISRSVFVNKLLRRALNLEG